MLFTVKKIENSNVLMVTINDDEKLNERLSNIMKEINGEEQLELYSIAFTTPKYEAIIEMLLLKDIVKQVELEEDTGYIVKLSINDSNMNFLVTKYSNDIVGKGYSIAKTLQG